MPEPAQSDAPATDPKRDFRTNPAAFAGWIGVASRDITPPVGVYARQWGAAEHDVAEGVHRPLCATALVMREAADAPPVVLIALDAFMFRVREDEQRIRDRVIEAHGLDASRVIMNCSHTHAACSVSSCDADKPGGHLIGPYLQQIGDAVTGAVREAVDHARPATMNWGIGRCGLATNRNLPDPSPDENRFVCGFNPGHPADDTVLVGRVTADDDGDRVIATVINYACHPTTLAGDNRLISPDYVGAMREVVQRHTDHAPCLFLQGASGELAPSHQYTGDTTVADAHGRQLGFAALAVLQGMLPPRYRLTYQGCVKSGAPLAVWNPQPFDPPTGVLAVSFDVDLPLKPLPDEQALRDQAATCCDRVLIERLHRKIQIVRRLGNAPSAPIPAWVWEVGGALFVAQPNETYSTFQTTLRRRFPHHAVVVMNIANGCSSGYLNPPEHADRDIYQVWQSPFDGQALPALIERCASEIDRIST